MRSFIVITLVGVLGVVGGILGYKAWSDHARKGASSQPAGPAVAIVEPPRRPVPGGQPPGTRVIPPPAGVTAAALLAQANALTNEAERLAAYERLVAAFPASPEAAQVRGKLAQARHAAAAALLVRVNATRTEADRVVLQERLVAEHADSPEAGQVREPLANHYRAAGKAYELRNTLSDMLWRGLPDAREAEIKKEILTLNESLIWSRRSTPDSEIYEIRPGDVLEVPRRNHVTPQLLMRMNNIRDARRIRFGDTMKIIKGPFDVLVELEKFRLTVLLRGRFVKEFRVGIGKDESSPIGEFKVDEKLPNPTWYGPEGVVNADDPKNPLGERWIGLSGRRGYGIHGTIEPQTIGQAASHGCVRMIEKDVEELYDLVVKDQSTVRIVK